MISVIIPTFKNKKQLLRNLKTNLSFLKNCEIIIVNDDPEESLKSEIKQFKNITLLENRHNLGFGQTVNRGVANATGKYIMLLNDDVKLLNNNYQIAINHFKKDRDLFTVSFAQKEKDGNIVGKNRFFWRRGLFFHQKAHDLKPGETGWAEGGACIINKKKFEELDGFDSMYSPFYWEDIDLSYRAKKAGYKILFDPNILVEHHHESTIGKYFEGNYIQKIAFRNQLLFIWKNITEPKKRLVHFLFLPYHLIRYLFTGKKEFLLGFIEALLLSLRVKRGISYE